MTPVKITKHRYSTMVAIMQICELVIGSLSFNTRWVLSYHTWDKNEIQNAV